MPDLEQQIQEWRRGMLASGIQTPVPLEELEGHLRDDIEARMTSGLNLQKAFDAAVERIGQPGAIEAEFAKTGEVMTARQRKSSRVFSGGLAVLCALLGCAWLFDLMRLFNPFLPDVLPLRERLLGAPVFFLFAVVLACGGRLCRFLPVPSARRTRLVVACVTSGLGLLGTLLLLQVVTPGVTPGGDLPPVRGAVIWAFIPWFVGTCLFFSLEEAACQRLANAR